MKNKVLTTGQIAKYCNVAPQTISKMIDSGQLRGFRLPGSMDRRVHFNDFVKFCGKLGYPIPGVDMQPASKIYIYGTKEFEGCECFEDEFSLGVACGRDNPRCIIIVRNDRLAKEVKANGYMVVSTHEQSDLPELVKGC